MTDRASDPGAALGLRERKKQRTERELSDAALRLALERGFDRVTIDDIAAEVEVSKTTFYRYYESKEDALLGKATEKVQALRAALADRPTSEPMLTAVRNAIMQLVDTYEHDRETSLARGRLVAETPSLSARNLEHQAEWEAVVHEFVLGRLAADGASGPDAELRAAIVAAIVVATLRATLEHWRTTGGREDLHRLLDTALGMLAEQRTALRPGD